MSELQEITVVIDKDGNVEIKVQGVKGDRCRDLTADLEDELGGGLTHREHTDEYHEQPTSTDRAFDFNQT